MSVVTNNIQLNSQVFTANIQSNYAYVPSEITTKVQITGTLQTNGDETLVVLGGGTHIATIFDTNGGSPTWDATLGDDNAVTTAYLDSLGLPTVVRDELDYTHVVRTSATVITTTFPAITDYEISADELWTAVFDATTNSYGEITASNQITIDDEEVHLVALDVGFDYTTNEYMEDASGDIVTDGEDVGKTYNITTPLEWNNWGGGSVTRPSWDETNKGVLFDGSAAGGLQDNTGQISKNYLNEMHLFALLTPSGTMPLFSKNSPVNFFELYTSSNLGRLRSDDGSSYLYSAGGNPLVAGTTYLLELIKGADVAGFSNFELKIDAVSRGTVSRDSNFVFGGELFSRGGSIFPVNGSLAHAQLVYRHVKSSSQATAIRAYLNSLIA